MHIEIAHQMLIFRGKTTAKRLTQGFAACLIPAADFSATACRFAHLCKSDIAALTFVRGRK
jgi:hypothetical protein